MCTDTNMNTGKYTFAHTHTLYRSSHIQIKLLENVTLECRSALQTVGDSHDYRTVEKER